jgi:hypothetical protein
VPCSALTPTPLSHADTELTKQHDIAQNEVIDRACGG